MGGDQGNGIMIFIPLLGKEMVLRSSFHWYYDLHSIDLRWYNVFEHRELLEAEKMSKKGSRRMNNLSLHTSYIYTRE